MTDDGAMEQAWQNYYPDFVPWTAIHKRAEGRALFMAGYFAANKLARELAEALLTAETELDAWEKYGVIGIQPSFTESELITKARAAGAAINCTASCTNRTRRRASAQINRWRTV